MTTKRALIGSLALVTLLVCSPMEAWAQGCLNPPWPDGCSIELPLFVQNGLNGIFLDACNNHDLCWSQLNFEFAPCLGLAHKGQCDLNFLANMEAACVFWSGVLAFPDSGWIDADDFFSDCSEVAGVFYLGVSSPVGLSIYHNSQCFCGCNANLCDLIGVQFPPYCEIFGKCGTGGSPGPCSSTYEQTQVVALDFEAGKVLHPERAATQGLTRTETIDGEGYFLEEWAVGQLDSGGFFVVETASSSGQALAQAYETPLIATPGVEPGGRYLVIETARHIGQLTEPLIQLESLRTGKPLGKRLPDGRVTFRARFSPAGDLEDVEVIEGTRRAGRLLAENLRVEFPLTREEGQPPEDDHRSVVFATFEVTDGRPDFVAAIPVLPQCCCVDWPTCPV